MRRPVPIRRLLYQRMAVTLGCLARWTAEDNCCGNKLRGCTLYGTQKTIKVSAHVEDPKSAGRGPHPKNGRSRDNPRAPLIGYMRVSKADGSQVLDLPRALLSAGVNERHLYSDTASGKKDDRPGLVSCLQALREGNTPVVWKLDRLRLGRSLRHLVNVVHDLTNRGIALKVLTGQGAAVNTTTSAGKLVFGIFASLAEFERDLISERTKAGFASARARGRKGGRRPKMTPAKLRLL